MKKFRGVHKHSDGGWVVTLGQEYLGYFREHATAIASRIQAEIDKYGQPFDRREIEISEDHAKIPLHGRRGVFYGWAIVDLSDLPLVEPIAWTLGTNGYAVGRPAGHGGAIAMHRLIMHGVEKGGVTDHASGDKLDNRRSNLRECTPKQNARNTRMSKNNTSGAKGVRATENGKWQARITVDRKEIHIGNYATIEEASAAYDAAALMMHGEFARTNAPLDLQSC